MYLFPKKFIVTRLQITYFYKTRKITIIKKI